MSLTRRHRLLAAILTLIGVGCDGLPDVDPTQFACVDDRPLEDGLLPCGDSHWCVGGLCTPRLGCVEPESREIPACNPGLRRCEPVVSGEVAAVRCEGGVHTETSTRPADPLACACPDGLHCVAYLEGPDDDGDAYAPDLRFLPEGGAAPGPEVPERRLCVRACSAEGNCSAEHTCRPALVDRGGPIGPRDTLAVCYPNVLPETSTTSTVTQPIRGACRQAADCGADEICQVQVDDVADHPVAPIGRPWAGYRALVARCASRVGVQLREVGRSCTNGNECLTGLCLGARCRAPCDPLRPEQACGRRNCRSALVERRVGDGTLVDRVHLCDQ